MRSSRRSGASSSARSDGNAAAPSLRLTAMRIITPVVALALVLVSCGGGETAAPEQSDSAAIYAVSLRSLVEEDNTFGGGGNPFAELFVLSSLDATAGASVAEPRALTEEERAAIETTLAPLAPVTFVEGPDAVPIGEGAALLGVGAIEFDDKGALVPMSMVCGDLCGTWFTYRVAASDAGWAVIEIEGPIAVS